MAAGRAAGPLARATRAWTSEEDEYVFVVVIDPGYMRRPVMLIPVGKVLVCPDDAVPGKRCYIPGAKAKNCTEFF